MFRIRNTLAEAHKALAETILIELELGLTFLDVAETTSDRTHARRNMNHAITALGSTLARAYGSGLTN